MNNRAPYLYILSILLPMVLLCGQLSAATFGKTGTRVFLELTTSDDGKDELPLIKWVKPINLGVFGKPTDQDIEEVRKIANEVNATVGGNFISLEDDTPNLYLFFMPGKAFKKAADISPLPAKSFVYLYSNANYEVESGIIFVADEILPIEKRAAIRTTITQSLGFTGQSDAMKYSSFRKGLGAYFPRYGKLEETLIKLMFREDVRPGMMPSDLRSVIGEFEF